MRNVLQGYDPNVLLKGGSFKPFSSFMEGRGRGLAQRGAQQQIDAENRRVAQNEALMGLQLDDPDFLQNAMSASPEIARELIKQKLALQVGRNKQYKPDNEWVEDPKSADHEIYMQAKYDPRTGITTSTPIPGMRRKKSYIDRLENQKNEFAQLMEFKKGEFDLKGKQFTAENIIKDKELGIKYAKLKNEDTKAKLEYAKAQWQFQQAQADAEVDYDKMEMKAIDGIDTIDRMIGNSKRGIKRHPGFEGTVGRKGASLLFGLKEKPFEGTDEAGFMALYNKVTGQAFMTAFEGLKGGGQITEMEGEKATQALIEMNTATDEKTFVDAARRFQRYVKDGMGKAKKEKKLRTPKPINVQDSVGEQTTPGGFKIRIKQ